MVKGQKYKIPRPAQLTADGVAFLTRKQTTEVAGEVASN